MKAYIYVITHTSSIRHYVGKTRNPEKRWVQHCWTAMSDAPSAKKSHLHHAIKKHGPDAFTYQVIEEWDTDAEAYESEVFWVEFLRAKEDGFNECPGGLGGVSGPANPLYGRKRDPAIGKKIAEKNRGRKHTPEHIEKCTAAKRGRKNSEETKRKMSEAAMGRVISESQREMARIAQSARTLSPETRGKIGAAHLGRKNTEETKELMRASAKARFDAMTPEEREAYHANRTAKRRANKAAKLAASSDSKEAA